MAFDDVTHSLIRKKTNGRCAYCGILLKPPIDFNRLRRSGHNRKAIGCSDTWTIDHLIPISRGGTDDDENLVAACKRCNSSKRDKTIDEYREWILGGAIPKLDAIIEHVYAADRYIDNDKIGRCVELIDLLLDELGESSPQFYLDQIANGALK